MKAAKSALILALLFSSALALGFIVIHTDSGAELHWTSDPHFSINEDGPSNSDGCLADPFATIQDAFSVWNHIPNIDIKAIYDGTTSNNLICVFDLGSIGCDSLNVIAFRTGGFPSGVLAATYISYETDTGVILEADIAINDVWVWSDDPDPSGPAAPQCKGGSGSGIYSLAAVITHEAGHVYGLDHNFVGYVGDELVEEFASTMFPKYLGNAFWRDEASLEPDDKAGLVYLYPAATLPDWGAISGKVQYSNGNGLFGVHISAIAMNTDYDPALPVARYDTLTGEDGAYLLYGLTPQDYFVFAESPTIASHIFTYWISDYYGSAATVPSVQLYDGVTIDDYSQLDQGSTTFDRASPVTVTAGAAAAGVDFVYPKSGGGGGGGGGGCDIAANRAGSNSKPDYVFPLVFFFLALSLFARRGLKRRR